MVQFIICTVDSEDGHLEVVKLLIVSIHNMYGKRVATFKFNTSDKKIEMFQFIICTVNLKKTQQKMINSALLERKEFQFIICTVNNRISGIYCYCKEKTNKIWLKCRSTSEKGLPRNGLKSIF